MALGETLDTHCRGNPTLNVFLTHPHWDHILGLPYFKPFYSSRFNIRLYGSDSEGKTLEGVLATQHRPNSFPHAFEHLSANIATKQIHGGDSVSLISTAVSALQLNHPGFDLGYRFTTERGTLCVLTDLAPIEDNFLGTGMKEAADGNASNFQNDYYSSLVEFVRGADLVYHDTNFTDEEIQGRHHWGHSTATDALKLLGELRAQPTLILGHHDPGHSDDQMDAIFAEVRARGRAQGTEVLVAREGGSFEL